MKPTGTRYITRTAMLLALVIVFQNLRLLPFLSDANPASVFVIGSLVNMALILSCEFAGLGAAVVISVLSAAIALMQGHIKLPPLMPIVALGNTALVVVYYLIMNKNRYLAVITGAVLKWGVLFGITSYLLGMFVKIKPEMLAKIIATFNFPQIVTALIGGALALTVVRYINKTKIRDDSSAG